MTNTIDASLYPLIYEAAYKVARKQVGFIPSVNFNFDSDPMVLKAGEDKNYITIPIAGAGSYGAYTPAQTTTVGGNSTDTMIQVQITENNMYTFHMTADEEMSLNAGAANAQTLFRQRMQKAMERLTKEIEADVAGDIYKWSSRAGGVAGTTPFASSLAPLTACLRMLQDNGAPEDELSFVMNAAASENFMNLAIVQQANTAGSTSFLRQGTLLEHLGFNVRVSREISSHTKGTATGYDNVGGSSIGDVTIAVDGSNGGTILAGDVITWAGDANKYVVADTTQSASGAADGNIVINKPGMIETITATVEGTTGGTYTPNIALSRDGYALVVRPPAIKATPILRTMVVQDSVSGLPFTICECLGDGLTTWRVHAAWGYTGVNPNFIATYMG